MNIICCAQKPFFIHGKWDPEFEPVVRKFEDYFRMASDKNSQLCVYVGDRCVIDAWGETPMHKQPKFTADTCTCIFSSSKMIAVLLMALMADQGHLNYDEKICTYWPEFAQNGKEDVTVEDLMKMEAGLEHFDTIIDPILTST